MRDIATRRPRHPVRLLVGVAAAVALSNTGSTLDAVFAQSAPVTRVQTLHFAGRERTFRVYAPTGPQSAAPIPLVLALHGGGGTGEAMERLTAGGFTRLAGRDGFVAAYPDGMERHWNDGRGVPSYSAHAQNVDDVGFVSALIDHLVRTAGVDRRRVYVTGISNGGLMAFRLARELSARVAAIAPVAISMSEQIMQMRRPARPVPVLMIPGTDDPLVPWSGGDIGFRAGQRVGRVVSVAESIRYWVEANGCEPAAAVSMEPDRDPQDGTRVRRETYAPCHEGAEVVLLGVEGGGHTWPGGWQYLPVRAVGRTSRDIDAAAVIWEFFRKHAIR